MILTYTILVLLSGICAAWAVLSIPTVHRWAQSLGPHSLMINVIASLFFALITGGFAWHAVSSGTVTGPPPPTPTPSASTPSTPTPGTGGPTTPLTSSPSSLDLPAAFVGTWKGTGHEFSQNVDFAVTVTLRSGQVGSVVGDIDRPTMSCHLGLVLDKVVGQSIEGTEAASTGNGICGPSGGQRFAEAGTKMSLSLRGASLDWSEKYESTSPTATGTLTKTS
jgi:hypothetical protein